jgi:hypothetical protein
MAAVVAAGCVVAGVASASPDSDATPDDSTTAAAHAAQQSRWGDGRGNGNGDVQGDAHAHGQAHGQGQGQATGQAAAPTAHESAAALPAASSIDSATEQNLLYMVEEEKLAHDVYVALGEIYDARQFTTIPRAEVQHQESVRTLLERYQLDDPTVGMPPGEFVDDDLQALYDELVATGSVSLADAAAVGVTIEMTDIADLTEAIDATDAEDVAQVLSSLRDGSQRHLAAFERLADRAA